MSDHLLCMQKWQIQLRFGQDVLTTRAYSKISHSWEVWKKILRPSRRLTPSLIARPPFWEGDCWLLHNSPSFILALLRRRWDFRTFRDNLHQVVLAPPHGPLSLPPCPIAIARRLRKWRVWYCISSTTCMLTRVRNEIGPFCGVVKMRAHFHTKIVT